MPLNHLTREAKSAGDAPIRPALAAVYSELCSMRRRPDFARLALQLGSPGFAHRASGHPAVNLIMLPPHLRRAKSTWAQEVAEPQRRSSSAADGAGNAPPHRPRVRLRTHAAQFPSSGEASGDRRVPATWSCCFLCPLGLGSMQPNLLASHLPCSPSPDFSGFRTLAGSMKGDHARRAEQH